MIRNANEVEARGPPSKKGGTTSATSSISAAAIARVLTRIHFPNDKEHLKNYARKNKSKINSKDSNEILNILNKLPDRDYNDMADVEKSIGNQI